MERLVNSFSRVFKVYKKKILFHLILNIVFALLITLSSYYHIPLNSFEAKFMYVIHMCITQASFAGFIYLLSLNKIIFNIIFSFLFVTLGIISFWTYSINISMSSTLVEVVLTTKTYIVKDLVSLQHVLFISILLGVLFLILKTYKKIEPIKGIKLFLPLSFTLIIMFFFADQKRTHSFRSKLPYSLFFSIKEYLSKEEYILKQNLPELNYNEFNKLKIVFILGESLRADHLGLNGYFRETTPLLSKRQNLVSFTSIYTNKTNTASSLPCILTNQSVFNSKQDSIIPLFSVFNSTKTPTYWIGNQLLENSYKPLVETNKSVVIIDKLKSYWGIGKKQDLELLVELKKHFASENYGLFTLHMIGSHWWYEDKYSDPFRVYKPVIDSKYIPSLNANQIINSYDNTILYLDNFLNEAIETIDHEKEPTILFYVADHGESLGENGNWLHSHTDALTKPGMMVWYSNTFKELYPNKVKALHKNKENKLTTDIVFHSLIDLIDINRVHYDVKQSIFK